MAASIGSLFVRISAQTAPFVKDLQKAKRSTQTFGGSMKTAGASILKFGSILTGVSFGGLAIFAKRQLEAIDEVAKLSDKLGVSTENLIAWHHGAEKAGLSSETLDRSLGVMVRNIGKFAEAGGPAAKRLDALGFSFAELTKMSSDKMFTAIVEQIRQLPTLAEQSAAAMEIFGKAGQDLMPIFQGGAAGLATMRAEADKLNLTFSREQAKKVEEFNDAMTDLKALIGGIGQQFIISIAPDAIAFLKGLTDWVRESKESGLLSIYSKARKGLSGMGAELGAWKAGADLGFDRHQHQRWLQKPLTEMVANQKAMGYLEKMAKNSEKGMTTRYAIP